MSRLPYAVAGVLSCCEFYARQPQALHRVPLAHACLIAVEHGCKQLHWGQRVYYARPAQLLILAAGWQVNLKNLPDAQGGYRAAIVNLEPALLEDMRQQHSTLVRTLLEAPNSERCVYPLQGTVAQAWQHLLNGWEQRLTAPLLRHRAQEVLLALLLAGHGTALWLDSHALLSQRVAQWLRMAPEYAWSSAELAQRLHCSEATLRRQLAREQTSLRQLLDDVRLGHGLGLLQTTHQPIMQIAHACGYASASRFAMRFRQRFGMSPSALRATL